MKYLIYFLALLDILTCIHMSNLLEMFVFDLPHILFVILFLSLIFSAIMLVWKTKKGVITNFIQFPFRVYFAIYSFWFLSYLIVENKEYMNQFFIVATILEILRLFTEIIIFLKIRKT